MNRSTRTTRHAAPGPAGGARTRAVLTREAIVAAGVELVEAAGPEALTMRAVAGRLGSGVMSLYRHVADRDALLDLVLEAMAGEIPATPPTGEWRTDAAALARDVRSALLRRPQLTVLLTSRSGSGVGGLAALDRALAIFRSAGLDEREAVEANHALGNLVAGAALWDAVGMGGLTGEQRRARRQAAAAAVEALPPDAYPSVAWAGGALFAGSPDERFEAGLAMLLDGIERRARPRTG
ncbi:MAG: TetR/AcrR family transcriptional regulator [Candidatus Nanopelagicales bacterium]|nr:TetR/AcrR family transcriptional regulator [Candidatus Nanopelagicales bacterium]